MFKFKAYKFQIEDLGIVCLVLLLGLEWGLSMNWRQVHDLPILNYIAFLYNKFGVMPYKELFETSMPGSLLFHIMLTHIIGYSDLALRIFDLLYFVLIAIVSYKLFSKIDKRASLIGICFFGLYYLWEGHSMSLERDYLAILPIIVAFYFMEKGKKQFVSGFFWGVAFWIKPHLLIGLLPISVFYYSNFRILLKQKLVQFAIGFFLFSSSILVWLIVNDALFSWWKIFTKYLPLHIKMPHNLVILESKDRWPYLWKGLSTFGQQSKWLFPLFVVMVMVIFAKYEKRAKHLVYLLISLVFVYWLYTAISGQFWKYHWMPFKYFLIMTAALIFSKKISYSFFGQFKFTKGLFLNYEMLLSGIYLIGLVVFSFFYVNPISTFDDQIRGVEVISEKNQLSDELTQLLIEHTKKEDKIQVLDWTEGSIQALLQAKRQIATAFMYDYVFYHQISNPYVLQLRSRFLKELSLSKPFWIIDMKTRIRVNGIGTTKQFIALDTFIAQNYKPFKETETYKIWVRK